jgi:putative oxidoreductase
VNSKLLHFAKLTLRTTQEKAPSLGLLVSRIPWCVALFYFHGLEKVTGFDKMAVHFRDPLGLGPHFTLMYATAADAVCSVLILLGILTRPAALLLFVNVLVALIFIHPWEERLLLYNAYFLMILLVGPGRYSLDSLLFRRLPNPGASR